MVNNVPIATKPTPSPRRGARAEGLFALVVFVVGIVLPVMAGVWYWIAPVAFRQHGIDGRTILFVLVCGVFTTLASLLSVGTDRSGARTHNPSEMAT